MDKVRMAFIGCGPRSIILQKELYKIREVEYVAACDLVEEKARFCARHFGALRWYTDYRKMLDAEALDAVAIVGPPQMHESLGVEALARGLHIFVEKPSATTAAGAMRLVETARKHGRVGMVGYMMRHNTAMTRIKKIATSPEFGRPLAIEIHQCWPMPRAVYWQQQDLIYTYLIANTVHAVDLMRFIMGDAKCLWARASLGEGGTLAVQATLEFCDGGIGQLTTTNATPSVEMRCDVMGSRGRMVGMEQLWRVRYLVGDPPGYADIDTMEWRPSPEAISDGEHIGNCGELKNFARSILAGVEPEANLWDGYRSLQIVEAIRQAVDSRAVVNLEN